MTEINIRRMTEKDLEEVAGLYQTSFSDHILVQRNVLNNPSYLQKQIMDNDQIWKVGEVDGVIKGVAALGSVPIIGSGELERACVHQDFRQNGLSYKICSSLMEDAQEIGLSFVEGFARGTQPAMQRTLQKLGFKVYGVAPRFEVMHNGRIVRENFVHMGKLLDESRLDLTGQLLIPEADRVYDSINPIIYLSEPIKEGFRFQKRNQSY
jgi:N-acetylglutamate synthase-like GNAT family acetyltransferase